MSDLQIDVVGEDAASDVLAVIHEAFGARPPLDPPTSALAETLTTVGAELGERGGLLARRGGRPVGALIFEPLGAGLGLRRVGVIPAEEGSGVAAALVRAAEEHARERGFAGLRVIARVELPDTVRFWEHHGFVVVGGEGVNLDLVWVFPHRLTASTREDTQAVAERLAPSLRAGDLLILTGDLGAGKTTFTQGLARGLHVRGAITSPTFVIARVHPSLGDGPPLVHVDAYRLGGLAELDDLDLDASLEDAVTVVEWGEGLAESLAADRLEVAIHRSVGGDPLTDEDPRQILVSPVGLRWLGALKEI